MITIRKQKNYIRYFGLLNLRIDSEVVCCCLVAESCLTFLQSQASLSMEFSRKEYWSGLPFPSPRDLPNSGIKSISASLQTDSLPSEPPGKPIQAF